MIEVTFLGTVSGVPTTKRNHPAIVLDYYSDNRDTILFDCGEGTQKQFMKSGISFMSVDFPAEDSIEPSLQKIFDNQKNLFLVELSAGPQS